MTKADLMAELDALGVEYAEDVKKSDLEALLDQANADAAPEEEVEEAPVEHPEGSYVATRNLKVDGIHYSAGDLYSGGAEHREGLVESGALEVK